MGIESVALDSMALCFKLNAGQRVVQGLLSVLVGLDRSPEGVEGLCWKSLLVNEFGAKHPL